MENIFDIMIEQTLVRLEDKKSEIYTFAFYHDHESDAISICVDTEEKSVKSVKRSNEFRITYFKIELENENLKNLKLWNFNAGRSFSLGDFRFVNIVRIDIPEEYINNDLMYLEMIKSIERKKSNILKYSKNPESIFFCCSSADSEVEYIWQ